MYSKYNNFIKVDNGYNFKNSNSVSNNNMDYISNFNNFYRTVASQDKMFKSIGEYKLG